MVLEVENSSQMTISTVSGEANSVSTFGDPEPPPAKKKRNLPGMPDPEAEVIALSPKALMATNRFVCEICSKGFQRDQNLQLHRRGHNLPWKLKQRSSEQPRKRVYVCPEPSCVHHDPARALGDLTGIKKHFSRKHGEKKWKCERCSKKYAVQSDWKAHMKTCGTREYKCDCGTLFSRRDSFITHRAFCDALAEESIRAQTLITAASNSKMAPVVASSPPPPPLTPSTTVVSPGNSVQSPDLPENHPVPVVALPPPATTATAAAATTPPTTSNVFDSVFASLTTSSSDATIPPPPEGCGGSFSNLLQAFTPSDCPATTSVIMEPPPSLSLSSPPPLYAHNYGGGYPTMSATALLQKAAQMGATTSSNPSFLCGLGLQMSSIPCQDNSNHQHHQHQDGGGGYGLGLGLGQSYGPTTLDLLGLGMGTTTALLNSYGNGFSMGVGGGGSSDERWDHSNTNGSTSGATERKSNGGSS